MATDDNLALIYGETVIDTALDIAKIKARRLGQCAELTIHDGDGDTHLKFTEVGLPSGLRADQAVEFSSSGSSAAYTGAGIKLDGLAVVRGMTVSVTALSMESKQLDKAAFDKIFLAAVAKVADAK
ncbi:hypothetical protein [Nocardia concava]|uniref:hypothetical protein n=1 Tax=Nocardia concava TaxID=257281 RepID=UPI0002E1EBA8|nr:hypothetical protein [Nocardia concava]